MDIEVVRGEGKEMRCCEDVCGGEAVEWCEERRKGGEVRC